MSEPLKFPAPYFGGKSAIADVIWSALGDVDNYIEPFCGSGAVLLARPFPQGVETVNDVTGDVQNAWRATASAERVEAVCREVINDADPHIVNVWRALQADPEGVAEWADHPVQESYLHAVHRWLVLGEEAAAWRDRLRLDPDFYDAKRAGRWLFGCCCWIGGGWCSTGAEWRQIPLLRGTAACGVHSGAANAEGLKRVKIPDGGVGTGVHGAERVPGLREKTPAMPDGGTGKGVHGEAGEPGLWDGKRPCVANSGQYGHGVHAKGDLPQGRPQLADAYDVGRGVHSSPPADAALSQQVPRLGARFGQPDLPGVLSPGGGQDGTCAARRAWLVGWFSRLRDRLRLVRVCCGDFMRVMGSDSVTTRLGVTGIFCDPPYIIHQKGRKNSRSGGLYSTDAKGHKTPEQIRDELLAYCLERGGHPLMRIIVACYENDGYEPLLEHGWTVTEWQAGGGYGNRTNKGKHNAKRERLFCSPNCRREKTLLDWAAENDAGQ